MTDFSYQLYSSRNAGPLDQTLGMLAQAGYASVEGFGGLYEKLGTSDLDAFRAQLDAAGLKMPTGHFSLDVVETDPDRAIAIARALGMEALYVPFLMPDDRPTDTKGWQELGIRLARAGAPIRAAGFGFGWHNHDFEFKPLADGTLPMEHILAAGDLDWEADIAWITRGGADPLDWIARHGNRITAAHVKDIAPEGEKAEEDGWADVGTGIMDWAQLLEALRRDSKAAHFVMEHDNPSDDARFARSSIDNARKLSKGSVA
ncbi:MULTISPECIES: sugar phosphate isomerase/epimerase [Thioclava]|uniref:Sugar phosphate isomerase/epimerase n=1 Tax=Thioclava electrotropha TaxID=1549850 RepID=A0ABX6YRY6_9RHOB|nr:sugar phosphate isomerase/epimerase [Thioclava electrotropha]QPZ90104.1 sugar phosphate isomerase/epimerase [Thioclava electrotropha]